MRNLNSLLLLLLTNVFLVHSQSPAKPILGVAAFTSEVNSKYSGAVAEKVVQVVTNSKRFTVVDRTSYDKLKQELEFQKSEAFLDSKNTVKQDVALAAENMIVGNILKMSIYAIKNSDGSVNGYKSSISFTLKVNEVESGKTTEAESFQTDVSPLMLSPESAVNEALKSVEPKLIAYFIKTFPLTTKICKILTIKKETALTILISGGKEFGFKEGDKLTVEKNEMIDGKPYPSQIGELKISKIAGDDFSECTVSDGGKEILSRFNAAEKLTCKLILK
ncbi:penicillin-binding protein activator LpoB [Flavobacterium sp. N1994]|uniref:penicillin-binding protein activator LpoB n=1 Tax=Flavobacterium sp. N1994 TaxID=2986827 RepID=UPI0022218374|nr:penicillin-binding protein activator LpoB [Flavobacterium sp. N1994]